MLPVGNSKIASRVAAFAAGKIPHAIMLEGERGLGRHTLAAHIAAVAVCESENKPCGVCKDCHLAEIGSHPDIRLISPEKSKQIKIDQIREVRQNAYLKPTMAARKVYIIENAETMNEAAQNAFLKVLEEPPAGVIFLLLTTSSDSLLDTVRSRCITLTLAPPQREQAADYIAGKTNYSAAEIDSALSASQNNIGIALEILKGERDEGFSGLARELMLDINGATAYDMMCKLKPYEKDRAAADAILNELQLRISQLLRESSYTHIKEGLSRSRLIKAHDGITALRQSAKANVNLMLLFANLCSILKSL